MPHESLREEFTESVLNSGVSWNTNRIADWWLSKREAEFAALREKIEGIKTSFIARCEHEDSSIDDTIKEETIYHIDHVLSFLPTPTTNEKQV